MKLWQLFSLSPATIIWWWAQWLWRCWFSYLLDMWWECRCGLPPSPSPSLQTTQHSWCLASCSALAVLVPRSHWGWIPARKTELETRSSCVGHACQAGQSLVNLLMEKSFHFLWSAWEFFFFKYCGSAGSGRASALMLQCKNDFPSLCVQIIFSWPYVN